MAVILFDLTNLSVEAWEDIINDIYSIYNTYNDIDTHVKEWFYTKFNAVQVSVYGNNNRFMKFPDKERYAEFCLTWL